MPKTLRFRCPKCGDVTDSPYGVPCRKCGTPLVGFGDSYIQIYRMGNFFGAASGMGIYINNLPFGSIGNRQSIMIPLPYGSYNLHFVQGISRRCEDLVVHLTPENPHGFVKVHMRPGVFSNTYVPEFARPEEMPPMD